MSRAISSRLAFIESLRLLAALLVFFQHAIEQYRGGIELFDRMTRLGPGLAGVVIFFVVSGYVVPMSVQKGFEPLPFMIRRVFRVYPLLLFVFAILFCAGASGALAYWQFMTAAGPAQWAANLLLVQDYVGVRPFLGVSWTLAIEFAWYALFALCVWRFGNRTGRILNVALPVLLLTLAAASVAADIRVPLGRLAMLYACVLGYQAYLFDTGALSGRGLLFSLASFLAVTWITNIVAFGIFSHAHISLLQALWPWTVAPIAFFVILLVKPVRNARLLNSGWLPAWGTASYSIYMFHPLGLAAARQYATSAWIGIPMAVAVTALLSFIGYRYVEKSGIGLGRRVVGLVRKPRGGAGVPAAG